MKTSKIIQSVFGTVALSTCLSVFAAPSFSPNGAPPNPGVAPGYQRAPQGYSVSPERSLYLDSAGQGNWAAPGSKGTATNNPSLFEGAGAGGNESAPPQTTMNIKEKPVYPSMPLLGDTQLSTPQKNVFEFDSPGYYSTVTPGYRTNDDFGTSYFSNMTPTEMSTGQGFGIPLNAQNYYQGVPQGYQSEYLSAPQMNEAFYYGYPDSRQRSYDDWNTTGAPTTPFFKDVTEESPTYSDNDWYFDSQLPARTN